MPRPAKSKSASSAANLGFEAKLLLHNAVTRTTRRLVEHFNTNLHQSRTLATLLTKLLSAERSTTRETK